MSKGWWPLLSPWNWEGRMGRQDTSSDPGDGSRGRRPRQRGTFPRAPQEGLRLHPGEATGDQDGVRGIPMKAGIFGPKFMPFDFDHDPSNK